MVPCSSFCFTIFLVLPWFEGQKYSETNCHVYIILAVTTINFQVIINRKSDVCESIYIEYSAWRLHFPVT